MTNLRKTYSKRNSGGALAIIVTALAVIILMATGAIIINAFYKALFGQGFFAFLAVMSFIGICILVLIDVLKGRT